MAMKTVVALPGEGIGLYRDGRVLSLRPSSVDCSFD